MSSHTLRLAAPFMAVTLALSGCGQGGSPVVANQAADAFFRALVQGDVNEAWSHLHPDSQHDVYDDDKAAFARDVNEADWGQLSWQVGPVVNFDYAWEIHFTIGERTVPDFLLERRIAGWSDPYLVMQVQFPGKPDDYLIIAWAR
jgi:hypothetical protein